MSGEDAGLVYGDARRAVIDPDELGVLEVLRKTPSVRRRHQPVLAGDFDAQALKGGPAGVEEPSGGRHLDGGLAIAQAVTISILKARVARIRLDPVRS